MSDWIASSVELARSGEGLKSGPLGLAVILVLCVASYFLFKSMSKHLKKVREEFPADASSADPAAQRVALSPQAAAREAAARELAGPQIKPAGTDDSTSTSF